MRVFSDSERSAWRERLPKRPASAAVLLENSIGQLLVVKANYKPFWTIPGGVIDGGETPKEAAIREVFEEVGITLDVEQVTFVSVANRESSSLQTYQFVFKAPLHTRDMDSIVLQASEIDEYVLVTREQVLAGDRFYAKAVENWARGIKGYVEQKFEE